jgi:flagellar M-ring protein FliF
VLGPGTSTVTTSATLDFAQGDSAASASAAADGLLGPDVIQVPEGGSSAAAGQNGVSETLGNAVNKTNEVRHSAPDVVKRLAIVVQMNIAGAGDVDPAQVEQLVGAAAGIDRGRGDSVTVLT